MAVYRDVQQAFVAELQTVVESGEVVDVRGERTRELRARLIEISDVRARHVILPYRSNNVFASIAESMWVIAGRNDLEFLSAYLKRASDFSDDGVTWRAGYGPRLRNWNGTDQLAEIVRILREDPPSRRAVVSIYDPDRDFVASRDIPCNNWLHFLIRNGQLDLHVAARSTDIWWGFSGINAFEWTLLLEVMARWLKRSPGRLIFFTSSLHLYERHFDRASLVLASQHEQAASSGDREQPQFDTDWEDAPAAWDEWMRLEAGLRSGHELAQLNCTLTDPLLLVYIRMMDLYWAAQRGAESGLLDHKLGALGDGQLAAAAREHLGRPAACSSQRRAQAITAGVVERPEARSLIPHLGGKNGSAGEP